MKSKNSQWIDHIWWMHTIMFSNCKVYLVIWEPRLPQPLTIQQKYDKYSSKNVFQTFLSCQLTEY